MPPSPSPILYDQRELASGIPAALEDAGVPVAPARLPAGDYLLSDRLAVERKTGADLAASIKDRRLFEQTARLVEAYPAVVLIVEGEPIHIGEASWMGALGRVILAGASVLGTRDARDTAEWLGRLHALEARGPSEPRGLPRVRRPSGDLGATAEDVLACLPGVSTVGARRLLAHFGSLAAVFAASEEDLLGVRGIGPVRARALARLFAFTAAAPAGQTSTTTGMIIGRRRRRR